MIKENWPIRSTDNWMQNYYLRQSFLESEERYLGDGFFPKEAQWFELYAEDRYNDGWSNDRIASFTFVMSLDTK